MLFRGTAYANTLLDLWDESEADYNQVAKFNWQDRYFIINLGVYRAWNLLCLGRASQAVAIWRENMDLLQSFDLMRGLMTRMWLAAGLLEIGDYGQALECGAEYDRKAKPVYTSTLGTGSKIQSFYLGSVATWSTSTGTGIARRSQKPQKRLEPG